MAPKERIVTDDILTQLSLACVVSLIGRVGKMSAMNVSEDVLSWDITELPKLANKVMFTLDKSSKYTASVMLCNPGTTPVGYKFRMNKQHALGVRPTPVGWIKSNDTVLCTLSVNNGRDMKPLLMQLMTAKVGGNFKQMPCARDVFADKDSYCAHIDKFVYPISLRQVDRDHFVPGLTSDPQGSLPKPEVFQSAESVLEEDECPSSKWKVVASAAVTVTVVICSLAIGYAMIFMSKSH